MSKNAIIGIIIAAIIIIGGFWLYQNSPAPTAETTPTPTETPMGMDGDTTMDMGTTTPTDSPAASPLISASVTVGGAAKTFTVDGTNFSFSPSTLSVNKGDKVTIIFKNTGGFHDFRIDEFNVATKKINGGQEETVSFVADKTGSFQYYCSVGSHRAMGMFGTLTVK